MNCSNSIKSPASIALGKWLKEARQNAGLNMRDLAVKMGCVHSFIGKYENAQRRLDVVEFVRVCDALGVDPAAGLALVVRTEQPAGPKTPIVKWRVESGKLHKWAAAQEAFVYVADVPAHLAAHCLVDIVNWYQGQKEGRDLQ